MPRLIQTLKCTIWKYLLLRDHSGEFSRDGKRLLQRSSSGDSHAISGGGTRRCVSPRWILLWVSQRSAFLPASSPMCTDTLMFLSDNWYCFGPSAFQAAIGRIQDFLILPAFFAGNGKLRLTFDCRRECIHLARVCVSIRQRLLFDDSSFSA